MQTGFGLEALGLFMKLICGGVQRRDVSEIDLICDMVYNVGIASDE